MINDASESTEKETLKYETITLGILIEQMDMLLDEGFLSFQDPRHAYLLSLPLF